MMKNKNRDLQGCNGRAVRSLRSVHFFLMYGATLAQENPLQSGLDIEKLKTGLTLLLVVITIPFVIALFLIIRALYRNTVGKKLQTTITEEYRKEAERYEKSGEYVSAAAVYESKLNELKKAAALYEKGGEFRKAAELYDVLGVSDKAKELYIKEGNIDSAAEVSIMGGEFEEAAKLYDKAGKKIDAALAMERAGRKLAAAREYREAGEYKRAAQLLEEEGLTNEAVEMFGFSVRGKELENENIEDFYTYAVKLEMAGEKEKAVEVLKSIDSFEPTYRDVRERLHALTSSSQDEKELEGKITLRAFIRSGELEPKQCLKLWVHILKTLQEAYKAGKPFGFMATENILIDSSNNISFLDRIPAAAYTAPEKSKELDLDARADIYSLGVLLFEMLTGSLEGLGSMRVADIDPDLPDWLDEMVIRCIRKVREDRYQSIEDIFAEIKKLSRDKKETE